MAIFLIASLSSAYGINITVDDELIFNFSFSVPEFDEIERDGEVFDRITIEEIPSTRDYNKPCLPVKPLTILLPMGTTVENIEVIANEEIHYGEGFNIETGGRLVPLVSTAKNIETQKISEIKPSFDSSHFSTSLFKKVGIYYCRGFPILHVNLFPVQYSGNIGEVVFYQNMKLVIETKESDVHPAFRGLSKDFDVVQNIVDNPSVIDTYKPGLKTTTNKDNYEYVIITNQEFKDANMGYVFSDLMNLKLSKGLNSKIVTVREISNNEEYQVGGAWGDNNPSNPFYQIDVTDNYHIFNDDSARIRNFIRYAYTEWGTDYVLLAGDADEKNEEDNIVPLRGLFANESGLPLNGLLAEEEDDIPSDVYYACLDGCFNYDLDEHFGECADRNDADDSIDEADLYSEVWVGRACIDSVEELNNFVLKTLEYEQMSFDPYIKEILFVGEDLGASFFTRWGGDYKDLVEEYVPSQYTLNKFYDRDREDDHWYTQELFEYLYANPAQMINHDGHGNHNYILKSYVDNIKEIQNEKTFFIYSHSCLTGSFDNYNCWSGYQEDDCIAEVLTCELPNGAYACILNARFGLGSEDSIEAPSGAYDESFYEALFTEDIKQLGAASHYSKEDNIWRIDENGYRWCFYQTNLFGDPNLEIKDPNDICPNKPNRPSGETNGGQNVEYKYTTTSTDPGNANLYYWFDWGDGTNSEWVGPFESGQTASANHAWSQRGTYEVKVKAKNLDGIQSEWSDPLSVSMPRNKLAIFPFLQKIFNFFNFFINL